MASRQRSFDPADAVVWVAAVLLSVLCGTGIGFVLWSSLTGTDAPLSFNAVVYAGILLAGALLSYRGTLKVRIFVGIGVASLLFSFAFGTLLWAPLLRPT